MKMPEASLNFWLFLFGVLGLVGTAGTLYFAFAKNNLAVNEKAAATLQKEKDKAAAEKQRLLDKEEIRIGQLRIEALEDKNKLLIEKNHETDIAHQKEVSLISKQHGEENRKIIEGKLVGEKSDPMLIFYEDHNQNQFLVWQNLGEHPAEIVGGVIDGLLYQNHESTGNLTQRLDKITLPARTELGITSTIFNIPITLPPDGPEMDLKIYFATLNGFYSEELHLVKEGSRYTAAFIISRVNENRYHYFMDGDFPLFKSRYAGFFGKTWPKKDGALIRGHYVSQ